MTFKFRNLSVRIEPVPHQFELTLSDEENAIQVFLTQDQLRDMVNTLHSQYGGPRPLAPDPKLAVGAPVPSRQTINGSGRPVYEKDVIIEEYFEPDPKLTR